MRKIGIMTVLVTALTMFSCTEVPEDVRSRTEEKEARASAAQEDSKAYEAEQLDPYARIPLSEVRRELDGYEFKAHDNLNFVCQPSPIDADRVYNIQMSKSIGQKADDSDIDRLQMLLKEFWNMDVKREDIWIYYDNREVRAYIGRTELGAENLDITTYKGTIYHGDCSFKFVDNHSKEGDPCPYIDVNKFGFETKIPEKCMDEKIKMYDGTELVISDAVKLAEEKIARLTELGMFAEEETHRLYRVGVSDYQGEGNIVSLRYHIMRHGIALDDSGNWIFDELLKSPYLEFWFDGAEHIMLIENEQSYYEDSRQEIEGIIPLSSAEYLASTKLAKYLSCDVTDVELRYVCFRDDDLAYYIYKPMWCFTLDEAKKTDRFYKRFDRRMLYIDAVTGKLWLMDKSSGYFIEE